MASLADRLEGELRGKQPDLVSCRLLLVLYPFSCLLSSQRATVAALTGGQVTTLNLDHTNGGNLENSGLTDAFVSLKKLSLNGVGLTTLKNLPVLPQLRKVLRERHSSQMLTDHSWSWQTTDSHQPWIDCLSHASCSHTCTWQTIDSRTLPRWTLLFVACTLPFPKSFLMAQKSLKHLRVLNIDSNPVANDGAYRQALFSLIPNLAYVDEEDRYGPRVFAC